MDGWIDKHFLKVRKKSYTEQGNWSKLSNITINFNDLNLKSLMKTFTSVARKNPFQIFFHKMQLNCTRIIEFSNPEYGDNSDFTIDRAFSKMMSQISLKMNREMVKEPIQCFAMTISVPWIKAYWKPVKSEVHMCKPNNINAHKIFLVK